MAKDPNWRSTELTGHTSGVRSVAFSPDGSQIVSGSGDGTCRVWEVSCHKQDDDEFLNRLFIKVW